MLRKKHGPLNGANSAKNAALLFTSLFWPCWQLRPKFTEPSFLKRSIGNKEIVSTNISEMTTSNLATFGFHSRILLPMKLDPALRKIQKNWSNGIRHHSKSYSVALALHILGEILSKNERMAINRLTLN